MVSISCMDGDMEGEFEGMKEWDVVIIGGGPGGYVAAVRASQLGLKTALVEKESLGGVCLNWGCIPTKSLLRNAEVIHLLSQGRAFGFKFDNLSVDYSEAHRRSRSVVARQARRIHLLMKENNVTVYAGTARLKNDTEVEIEPSGETLGAKHIIVATGARPRELPGTPFDGHKVITYRNALELTEVPLSVAVIGAGPIGMEFATLWNRYGSRVTVVEWMPRVLPLEDEEISIEAERQFKRVGIKVKTNARVESGILTPGAVDLHVSTGEGKELLSVEKVLVAIGFDPSTEELGLETVGIATTRGYINVDEQMRTNVAGIYAIGDVTGKLGLAHVASAQGIVAAEAVAGKKTETLDYAKIPRCTYAYPEVASVGLTERQAREHGYEVITAQCPFVSNGKALAMNENFGFVKVVGEEKGKTILGVHLVGSHVTELVAGPAGMITLESTVEDLGRTVHPHPTMSEALMEAVHALLGRAVHL
jgi:dihydrolipoamide dehydrogenase